MRWLIAVFIVTFTFLVAKEANADVYWVTTIPETPVYWVTHVAAPIKKVLQPKRALASELPRKDYLKAFAYKMADKYKINSERFIKTLECESGFNESIQSNIKKKGAPNGREDSWGVAQIHLPAHPSVSREGATDGEWALEWAARNFQKNPRIWTCYRNLYKK